MIQLLNHFYRYAWSVNEMTTRGPAEAPVPMPKAFASRLGLMLVRVGDEMSQRGQQALEELGISGRDYTALAVIAADQPRSQLELARMMGKAPALCVALIDELETAGLAQRVRDPEDRRRSIVSLTSAGEQLLERADAIADEVAAAVLDGLSADELGAFRDLTRRAVTETTTEYQADVART